MRSWRRGCGSRRPWPATGGPRSRRSSWPCRRGSTELRHELAVELVGQLSRGFLWFEPGELVHLVVRLELARLGLHAVVAHELRAVLVVGVARVADVVLDAAAEPGLLLHLAQRRLLEVLALVELALREAPVVVARAVDHGQPAVP